MSEIGALGLETDNRRQKQRMISTPNFKDALLHRRHRFP